MAFLRKIGPFCLNGASISNASLTSVVLLRKQSSAGIIVIGEEILKGQVADTNSHFIARHLFDRGIKVKRISVIGDEEDEIAKEVLLFSKNFSYVITTGGIGPTHDDVTFSAIAKAFGEEVKPHPELVKLCADFFKTEDLNSPAMKLAHIPESAKLLYGIDQSTGKRTLYPNISVHNVYIFPGIPILMQKLFLAVQEELFKEGNERIHVKNLYLSCTEVDFAEHLNHVVSKYPSVTFGSYPKLFDRFYKVHVTIQSVRKEECEKAYNDLLALIPRGNSITFTYFVNDCVELHSRFYKCVCGFVECDSSLNSLLVANVCDCPSSFLLPCFISLFEIFSDGNLLRMLHSVQFAMLNSHQNFEFKFIVNFDTAPTQNSYEKILNFGVQKKKNHVQNAVESIEQFCEIYRPAEMCVVFNGDPESVVLTHLIHGCLRRNSESANLNGVTFMEKPYTSELEQFIQETQARYNMKLERFSGPLSNTLNAFIDVHEHFKVVFVGCVADENSDLLQLLTYAEKNHPTIQWVNPLKDWMKTDVWDFIDSLSLPYSTFNNSKK
ncbi:uncharacterized protein GBIM_14186 [Gryllus bimaculatus]|nr:uncharacterized protein GBIM_14186 [Gryllus bimaculatus]